MDPATLRSLLEGGDLHEASRQADDLRRDRFQEAASYAVIDHLDPGGTRRWCPICGEEAGRGGVRRGFVRRVEEISAHATDIHVLPEPAATADEILALLAQVAEGLERGAPATSRKPAGTSRPRPTFQVDVASTLAAAADGASREDADFLARLQAHGLRQVSDGIRPHVHPGGQTDAMSRWERFWHGAASAGLKGHTTVLYGPDHDGEDVLRQIERIGALQGETGVFLSVTPVIHAAAGFGGVQDNLLTHGSQDLKVLAACRLGLAQVPHVRVSYNRSDLKLAHVSLACGADDVDGHLELRDRDRPADADAFDLSLREIPLWLREAGFAPRLRNGMFESVAEDEGSPSAGGPGDPSTPSSSS